MAPLPTAPAPAPARGGDTPPPPTPPVAASTADATTSDRPWYKYIFRTNFFFGGDAERAAARFAIVRRLDALSRTPAVRVDGDDVRAFVAQDPVYGPRLAAAETQSTASGLAGVLSGVAVGSSMVRRTGSIFPLAALGALLGGVTGNLFADHVASWVLGTYKHDPVATREALTAFAVQRHPPGSPPPPST